MEEITNIRQLALFKIDDLNPSICATIYTIYQHQHHEWAFDILLFPRLKAMGRECFI